MTTLFRIESDWLSLRCTQAGLDESRPLTAADESRFRGWLRDYHDSLRGYGDEPARLRLGRELYAWLDGDAGWLAHSRATALAPWIVDFRAPRDPDGLTRLFLQLPWELLADDRGYLAADLALRYAPVRRLGEPAQPEAPSPCRLSLVFMAAAPRDQRRLNYEAEETAILDATAKTGLDLTVEESGTLEWLAAHMAEEAPVDVLHLSCHGQGGTEPALCLETDEGATDLASVGRLIGELSTHRPRLLFLSAGNSARSVDARDGSGIVDSLALAVLREGMPAVLGWDGSVSDAEATEFAAHLYRQLSRKADLQAALAEARFALLNRIGADPLTRSRDWHLARLFLGPTGGGPLVKGDCARHRRGIEGGHKEFLDAKGQQIPVAGRLEFVGRRRLLQDALRELRQRNHAGVLIHGMARQGKSSLAARVANRLHHHGPVVVFEHYDAPAILEAFRRAVGGREVRDIIDAYRDRVRQHPDELADGLRELLEGPCRELVKDDGGRITSQPVLLVLDDLERILCDPGPGGLHRVQPEWVPVLRAVLEAFAKADSDSRLLMTSRFRFTLPQQDGRDLADALFALHLPPMETAESRQQAARKARPAGQAKAVPDEARTQRCIALAQGNPGLQDRLFSLSLQDPAACDQALTAMERYLAGQLPDQETVRAFLENLAIDHSLAVLKPGERELLRAATLFELPVPLAVLDVLAKTLALDAGEPCGIRLIGLGLWDVYPDMVRYSELAPAVNALVRPLAGTLTDGEIRALAGVALPELLAGWGGADGSRRPYPANYELARLAVRAGQPLGLEVTAEPAIRWLGDQLRYREAAQLARQAVACLDRHQIEIPLALLRVAGEACVQVGDTPTARSAYRRALARLGNLLSQGQTPDIESHAALLIAHSRLLVQDGYPNEALEFLEQTKQLLSADPRFQREHSIVLGDIARIMVSKGEVDAALQLHQDRLTVFQALGDQRERAVTLGDIARIMVSKGEVDAALQLHQEELTVYQVLGDPRSRAVTLGDIAWIKVSKGELNEAIKLHQEMLTVFQALGDQRSRAVTLGRIADVLQDRGELDEALRIRREEELPIYEQLGDVWSRAVTLGKITQLADSIGNSLTNEASEFFKQANFIVTPLSGNLGEFIVNGKNWATHINYGDILLKIIQGNLSGGHLRDLEAKLNSLRVSTTLAYVVFEGELLDEAFWQMVAYKLGKELTIIPLKAEFLHEALVAVKPDCFVKLRIVEQEYLGCGANRYEESNAIIDPTLFFGRQAEVGEILDRLKSGQHAGIFGMRKIGKTSLLLHLKQTVSCLSVPVAYLGLQSKMIDPFLLFRDVVQQLRSFLEKMGVSALPECGLLASQPVINTDRLFMEDIRALWEIARTELKVPFMLLMVDEADRIVPRSGSAISVYEKYDQFFAPIRELSQVEHCLLTVVTAERSTICEEFKQSPFPNTMFELYHERYLVSFSVAELENMITRIGKWMELEYSTESLRTIAEESACHPYVARSLCACIARNVKAGMVAVQEVVQAREDALDRLHQYFLGWWNNLAPEEQQIIHAVLTTQALPTDMTGSQQDAVRYLQKQQSITQTPTGWTITIGLLREWLNQRIGGNKENSGSAKSLQNDSAS